MISFFSLLVTCLIECTTILLIFSRSLLNHRMVPLTCMIIDVGWRLKSPVSSITTIPCTLEISRFETHGHSGTRRPKLWCDLAHISSFSLYIPVHGDVLLCGEMFLRGRAEAKMPIVCPILK
ncbi:hypothetical protein IW261DRAFT_1013008 [Armillaria novae-zelandiae]|uniref:Uncharacterized protein n=1 Tax=Armillaria novae-zelandiae TaxID=153914 RepID=A0AA39NNK8_9AGAR|nr:hypothetical protein IW261DRAFT_1013008 [Armillaria novae-zelandiae]